MNITPEQLAAYADDQLETDERLEVEAELERHPELRAQVAAHRRLQTRLSAHFSGIVEQPVPGRLIAALGSPRPSAEPIDIGVERAKRALRPPMPRWLYLGGPAIAASLLLAMWSINVDSSGRYASGTVNRALETQLVADQPNNAPVRIILSFEDKAGRFCRAYDGPEQSGLACRNVDGWLIEKRIGASVNASGEYQQAGSRSAELMSEIQAMAKGPALDATAEREAQARGWRQ